LCFAGTTGTVAPVSYYCLQNIIGLRPKLGNTYYHIIGFFLNEKLTGSKQSFNGLCAGVLVLTDNQWHCEDCHSARHPHNFVCEATLLDEYNHLNLPLLLIQQNFIWDVMQLEVAFISISVGIISQNMTKHDTLSSATFFCIIYRSSNANIWEDIEIYNSKTQKSCWIFKCNRIVIIHRSVLFSSSPARP
jgi:hypothetical protein